MALDAQQLPLDQLHRYPGNPRRGDLDVIRDSLRRNGQYRPLVVQRSTRFILAGNHTAEAMAAEGWTTAEVVLLDVDDDAARRIVAADNRTSDLASYDERALVSLLRELGEDLTGTGWDTDDYDDLLASLQESDAELGLDDPSPLSAATGAAGAAYGEGGSANGTNVRQTPSYKDYEEGYATRATRFLALIFPLAQYAWVVERLSELTGPAGADSHSEVLLWLLAQHTDRPVPPADAEMPREPAEMPAEEPAP